MGMDMDMDIVRKKADSERRDVWFMVEQRRQSGERQGGLVAEPRTHSAQVTCEMRWLQRCGGWGPATAATECSQA